ncbi:MAG: hypothetical protein JXA98_04715 [Methanosarcinaceae archaeon]|nr:hypothetical protein [Methanosarcinaceae archaeon]
MALETYLITLKNDINPNQAEQVLKTLVLIGGQVNMAVKRSIIASFDSSHVDSIRRRPGVKLVGGVKFRKRTVKKRTLTDPTKQS